jgi:CDP-glucose 4,6-dehydratase
MVMNRLFKNFYTDKRVLVTGDTGFKGSWLCIWLHELGAHVYGYALPAKTPDDNFVRSKLSDVIHHIDGDVRDDKKLADYVSEIQPQIAFHLAAQPLVLESYKNPQETFSTNLMGTVNFFEAVRKTSHVKAAVIITSDKCYQNNDWVWGYRESDPMGGNDPYSASKGCAELITHAYVKSFFSTDHACAVASARAGNVIGGGDWAEHRIVPDIFRALHAGQPVLVRNPNAIRPWQHVLEPLSGYLLLASKLYAEGKSYSGGWNFGPPDENQYTVLEVVQEIIKRAGKGTYRILEETEKPHEANVLKLDVSKSSQYLDWQSVLTFDETMDFTVSGYHEDTQGDLYSKRVAEIDGYNQRLRARNLKSKNV